MLFYVIKVSYYLCMNTDTWYAHLPANFISERAYELNKF